MKRHCKRFLAWLLLPALLIGMLSGIAFAEGAERTPERVEGHALGKRYLSPVGDYSVRTDTLPGQKQRGSLPPYYNSTDLGYGTPVRDQNPYGSCWAHAAIASCEMYMIKHGVPVGKGGAAATNATNLSEYQLLWFSYTDAYDKPGMLAGNVNACDSVFLDFLDVGGNGQLASDTLMRWEGLASEDTPALSYDNVSREGLPADYAYQYNVAHVQDCVWIPASDRDAVKAAIMEYGGGTIGYYHDDAFDSDGAYYYNGAAYSNHDVTLVGWDDGYSRDHFKGAAKPSEDGAWIVKNSWGTAYGQDGYYYLSYQDASVNQDTCYFYAVEAVDNYDNNYQYDGTSNFVDYWAIEDGDSVANVFTAKDTELLSAVAFSNSDAGIDYTLQIYTGVGSDPTDGTPVATQRGSFPYAGYHTVQLETPVRLNAGEKFSVVFTLNNRYGSHTTLSVDKAGFSSYPFWMYWYHPVQMGTSYWWGSVNGMWLDVSDSANLRIKAYTECPHDSTSLSILSEPTCTETGYGSYVCDRCGDEFGTKTISALGHTFGAWEPLADSSGKERRVCTRCGITETRDSQKPGQEQSFSDCNEEWYREAVNYAVNEGLMNGVGGGKFSPDGTMNRAMMVTVLYRVNGAPPVGEAATFSDVSAGEWYSDAIAWAQDGGFVGGVGNNRFAPEDSVTREQIATILWRSEGRPSASGELGVFRDADGISDYALDAMRWAVAEGIFNGDGGRLKPTDCATRAEFACIVMRYLEGK